MKQIILIVAVLTFIVTTSTSKAGWFNDNTEKEHELESQLQSTEQSKGSWQVAAFILGVGCVTALVAGAAIGSKGRRHARREQ